MSTPLYSLLARGSHQVEIRKSRFLAQSAPVTNVDAALAFVREVAQADANHNCWAWRIGQEYRFHDDGEPSSSAGKPILAAIDGQDLDRTVVVVTRWFGGIKLGIGGLVRAYGGTAATCLREGDKRQLVATVRLRLDCAQAELGLLEARLPSLHGTVLERAFGGGMARLELSIACAQVDALESLVAAATRGQGRLRRMPGDP